MRVEDVLVECPTFEDLQRLAAEMKVDAMKNLSGKPIASPTEEIAIERAKMVFVNEPERPTWMRVVLYNEQYTTVVLTLVEDSGRFEWNLSMSKPGPKGIPARADDAVVAKIVEAFLGDDFQEVEPKAVWKDSVRHFTSIFEDKRELEIEDGQYRHGV